jgi:hypothetical protein
MKRAIVWGLVGAIVVASLAPVLWGKLSNAIGAGRFAGQLVDMLYVALFSVMNVGYLNAIRGRRHFELRDSTPGQLVTIEARPLSSWTRVHIRLAPDRLCYAAEGGYTTLAIIGAAIGWLAIAVFAWRAAHAWWLAAAVGAVGAIKVWMMTRRAVAVCSSHGSEDAFGGARELTSQLQGQLAASFEATSEAFTSRTLLFERSTVFNLSQLTAIERVQETPWALILLAILAIVGAAMAKAVLLVVVAVVFICVAILLARPHAVARFEGGAELPIPEPTFAALDRRELAPLGAAA